MSYSDPKCHPECIEDINKRMEENFKNCGLDYFMRHHLGSCDKLILDKIETSSENEIIECIDLIKRQKKRCQNRKYKANAENKFHIRIYGEGSTQWENLIKELDGYIAKFNEIIKEYGKRKAK